MDLGRAQSSTHSWLRKFSPTQQFSYPVARIGFVLLTAATFFILNLLFGGLIGSTLTHDVLSAPHARWFLAFGLAVTAFFAGQGGSFGFLNAYAQGRIRLRTRPPAARAAINPWRVGLMHLITWGMPVAAVSFWLVPLLWPSGAPLKPFLWAFAICSAVLSGAIVALLTGPTFLAQTQLSPPQRRFAGSTRAYLWQRHALPQAMVNGVFGAVLGGAIMPVTWNTPGATISAAFVRTDMIGCSCVLGLCIVSEVYAYARFERRWGVAPALASGRPRVGRRIAWSALAFAALTALACALSGLGLREVSVSTFLIGRTLGCGVLCGWIAYCVACWVMQGEPAGAI